MRARAKKGMRGSKGDGGRHWRFLQSAPFPVQGAARGVTQMHAVTGR
jgi:hypothetical protein